MKEKIKPAHSLDSQMLQDWEERSLGLLRKATTPFGIKASCTNVSNYGAIFTRDAVMSGIAGLVYHDQKIIDGLRSTIENLYKIKGSQGQIASNYHIEDAKVSTISYGTLSPKYDSATWYLLAIAMLNEAGYTYEKIYVTDTINLLNALEYNGKDLIYVPQGGNWADEYNYEGYILYDQILRSWALQKLGQQYNSASWLKKSDAINEKIITKYYNKNKGYFNCTYTPAGVNTTFDFAAHCLLGHLDIFDDNLNYSNALDWIGKTFLAQGNLPIAFHPIIHEGDDKWKEISNFHMFEFRNKPYHFHNGGIWFIWLGWYALTLIKHKRHKELDQLAHIAFDALNSIDNFQFDEYLTSDNQKPNGTKELCYTATGILFLCKAIKNKIDNKELL